jgi:hypothetical protein
MTGVEPALDQLGRLALCLLSFIRMGQFRSSSLAKDLLPLDAGVTG